MPRSIPRTAPPDLETIRRARELIAGQLRTTPCLLSEPLSKRCGTEVHLKLETLQRTGSFKPRGALHRILRLGEEERLRGVIAVSAGNHAQGVAFAAATAGVSATIVMPESTPLIKVTQTRALGAEVILHGAGFDDAAERARELEVERGLVFVHPFDDVDVIAGQGTVGLEIVEQVPDLEAVVVPIGGGGLISGIAIAVRALRPEVAIYGVQCTSAPAMKESFDRGAITPAQARPSIAEGITVKHPVELTFDVIRRLVTGIELVTEEEIEEAIFALLETGKVVAEGAGASALAALLAERFPQLAGRRVVTILTGANIDLNILHRIIDRSLVKQHRLVRLEITVRDRPGALAALLTVIAEQGANVLHIRHSRAFAPADFWETDVELTLETRDREHIAQLLAALAAAGYAGIRGSGVELVPAPLT